MFCGKCNKKVPLETMSLVTIATIEHDVKKPAIAYRLCSDCAERFKEWMNDIRM